MTAQSTTIRVPNWTTLNDEQRAAVIADVILMRFRKEFRQVPQDQQKTMARNLAGSLVRRSNECGEQHLMGDLARQIKLNPPSEEECRSLEELMSAWNLKFVDGDATKMGAVEKAAGVTWRELRKLLGLPITEPDRYTGSVAGPRA